MTFLLVVLMMFALLPDLKLNSHYSRTSYLEFSALKLKESFFLKFSTEPIFNSFSYYKERLQIKNRTQRILSKNFNYFFALKFQRLSALFHRLKWWVLNILVTGNHWNLKKVLAALTNYVSISLFQKLHIQRLNYSCIKKQMYIQNDITDLNNFVIVYF